jgi:cytosine/creatinine deaminase
MRFTLRGGLVRGLDGERDIVIAGGSIEAVTEHFEGDAGEELDVHGCTVLPGLVDPHVHLDKCLLRRTMRPNESGTLSEAIDITNDFKRTYDPDEVAVRAVEVIKQAVMSGTTALRSFVDVGTIGGLVPLEGLQRAREQMRGLIDIEIVAFPQEGIVRDEGAHALLDEALSQGADVVGGLPWYEYTDADARQHIDLCFELAKKHKRPIHMLVDDTDDANSRTLEYLARKTMLDGFEDRVAASHCGAMAAYNDTYAAKIVDMVATAGVHIVSNAHISLMLAGRNDAQPVRRGITRVRELLEAGVNVASGQDDVHDPYYPFGVPDQLEVATFMAHAAHFGLPHELDTALDMVTTNAARVMAIDRYGVAEGMRADLVVVEGEDSATILRNRAPRRYVFKSGRMVARTTVQRELYM